MTVEELINHLMQVDPNFDVYVNSPDSSQDFFVEGVSTYNIKEQVFIETSE
jgi:hypothetical protein